MKRRISVCDNTIRTTEQKYSERLSFNLKIEMSRILDKMGISVIEMCPLADDNTNFLLVKAVAATVKSATVAIPVDTSAGGSPESTWDAVRYAAHPRLQVPAPVSTVQMEYFLHRKPSGILEDIRNCVSACSRLCNDVEFIAEDFTRSEREFLDLAISTAVEAGASIVTLFDCAGELLPEEMERLVRSIKETLPEHVKLGVRCSNGTFLADSCSIAAVQAGADEIKTTIFGQHSTSVERFSQILEVKKDTLQAESGLDTTTIRHYAERIRLMCESYRTKSAAATWSDGHEPLQDLRLSASDDMESVMKAIRKLGYELFEEDKTKVHEAFLKLASTNEFVTAKELDAIVASVAFQVPPTYRLDSYVTNSGNVIAATCHIRIRKGNDVLENVSIGDGPIDAAFQAIDTLLGNHYELDDFQIKSVTEGRQAMGDAVVRLRFDGKVYSGRGVSTDIIGSSIMAYLNAVNKIAYEEAQY